MTTTPAPPTDPATMSDDELRAALRDYGLNSPWKGDEADYTLRDELHARMPYLAGLWRAIDLANKADVDAAVAVDPNAIMNLSWEPSPATTSLRDCYQSAVDGWIAGSTRPETPASPSRAVELLEQRGKWLARARQETRLATESAQAATLVVLDAGLLSEVEAAQVVGVDRMTVRRWRGK